MAQTKPTSTQVVYDNSTAEAVFDNAKSLLNYTTLRAYTGRATSVRITTPGVAGFFRRNGSAADNGITVIKDGLNRSWERIYEGSLDFAASGVLYGDVTDSTAALVNALAVVNDLTISGKIYTSAPTGVPSNKDLRFVGAGEIVALVAMPHILGTAASATNVNIFNPVVDGASIRGCNGYGFDTANGIPVGGNIRVLNPTAKNCIRDPIAGGGRAFTAQANMTDVVFSHSRAVNCTTACDVNGSATLGLTQGIAFDTLYAENCQEVVSAYSDGTGTNATTPPTNSNAIFNIGMVIARNCGRTTDTVLYSGAGVAGDRDGGIMVSRRGRNVHVENMIVYNDLTYTIGAVFRGTGNNISVKNCEVWGNVDALAVIGSAENLLPLANTNDPTYGLNLKVKHHGAAANLLDMRVATGSNYLTGCNFDFEVDEFPSSSNILASATVFRDDSYVKVTDVKSQKQIEGALIDVFSAYNTLAAATGKVNIAQLERRSKDLVIESSARLDFTSTSAGAGVAAGYILIKVGGATKKLQYYDV